MNPYKLIYGFGWTLSLLPLPVLYLFSEILAFLVWHVVQYRKKVVFMNLRKSFPDWSEKEIRRTARRFYRQFADQVMESFRIFHLNEKQILKRVRYKNPELLEEYYEKGQSVLLAAAHFGNWEWLVSLPLVTRHKVLIVYKPPKSMNSDFVYMRFGARYGGISVKLPNLPRTLLQHQVQKELTATFLVVDQSPVKEHIRNWNTLMNQDTAWNEALDRLAKKTKQPVVFIQVEKASRGHYEVTFHPIAERPEESGPHEITNRYAELLESSIRSSPELWLWTHRRWKLKKTVNYK